MKTLPNCDEGISSLAHFMNRVHLASTVVLIIREDQVWQLLSSQKRGRVRPVRNPFDEFRQLKAR